MIVFIVIVFRYFIFILLDSILILSSCYLNISEELIIFFELVVVVKNVPQEMFRSLHTSLSVAKIKSTINIQIIKGLLQFSHGLPCKELNRKGSTSETYILWKICWQYFCVFESELDAETFHTYLNTKHKNIKFTYGKQIEKKLPFLDIWINNNKNLQTSVFHKKTYTGLLLDYFSFVPDSYKYGLIKTLIDRMYRINSTCTTFDVI